MAKGLNYLLIYLLCFFDHHSPSILLWSWYGWQLWETCTYKIAIIKGITGGACQQATVTPQAWLITMQQIQNLPDFYELHLIVLCIICFLSLLADRYLVGTKTKQNLDDGVDERRLESAGSGSSSSLATLTRKYLVVYGIVMGSLVHTIHSFTNSISFYRSWLATGPIRVFSISRTVRFPREASCSSLRHRFHLCRIGSSFGWCMGGPTVRF
jgi:hypothetical protein